MGEKTFSALQALWDERLTIDLSSGEHRKIKAYAAYRGETLKKFVLESIRNRIEMETEKEDFLKIMTKPTSLLEELWDNETDAAYDDL